MAGDTGIYGKHPGFGDFISAGLSDAVLRPFADWSQAALGAWRAELGERWQSLFDVSPRLCFWIGPALMDGSPLRGVWSPSRDRSGRRFPFIALQSGGASPLIETDQRFYMIAGLGVQNLLGTAQFEPRDAADRLRAELPNTHEDKQPDWPTFWAVNSSMDASALMAGLASADHAHAMASRSYWWFSANEGAGSGLLACQGLPGPSELGWLLTGGVPQQDDDTGEGPHDCA
ncbi:type VI secretion system-associated protein TagF [Paracoccus sp. 11-3]|uniref:Type VI secretion system-associated protein TagF n=1 Tax=Paracoccus amoyensis TaxID=2760093 RepID=A0A926GEG3_9RHOB|nr:type VI secretion system-associated protein TagF [Paracoccus amoyensis]MBC9246827.1 type VI secretion system-associated protein TagF [Paracoccus amoyensis]